jgi:hypothetical protein
MAARWGQGFGERSGFGSWPMSFLPLVGGPRVAKGGLVLCPGRCKLGPNLGQGWVVLDTSVRLRRTARARHNGLSSGRTSLNVRMDGLRRPARDALR